MVMRHSACVTRHAVRTSCVPSPLTTHHSLSSRGFTLIEMLIVLFLLAGVLAIVLPRVVIGEDMSSTGRKFIGTLRTLQGLAATGQKPVKLYLDLDRGTYWAMVVDGKEEKLPLDAAWTTPRSLPEAIRFMEVSVGQDKRTYGRADLSFFPNGRIDPVTVLFSDRNNNILALAVDSFTGAIRTSEERIEPLRNKPIPDRVRTLLRPPGT
jgi:prepilin-type N-terminal cleavage/methylation domain-containing protein